MASKWLEERWEVLMPVLGQLGCAQEEQIKSICEAELNLWRQRPTMRKARSLCKPLTDTRNHIRVSLPVTEENGWVNPKSGQLEHLALKHLNFSTQEWMQMNMPPEEELQARLKHPLPLSNPSALVSKAAQLVQMNAWPELVVGIGLSTGRGLVEVLQTGHFTVKSAYLVDFAGPMTIYEQMCDPFEVPTLVHAELVLAALHQLRGFFGNHFEGMARREISRQCTEQVREAAYQHLLGLMGLREGERNIYKVIAHGVYPRLATWCYCPAFVDEILYMATIQNHRKILEVTALEERRTLAVTAGYMDYVIVDATGAIDQCRGIRLGEPGVEVLIKLQEKRPEVASSTDPILPLREVNAEDVSDPTIGENWDEEDQEEYADVSTHHPSARSETSAWIKDSSGRDEGEMLRYLGLEVRSEQRTSDQRRRGGRQDKQEFKGEEEVKSGEDVKPVRSYNLVLGEMKVVKSAENELTIEKSLFSTGSIQSFEGQQKRNTRDEKGEAAMDMEWLKQRWKLLIAEMAEYDVDNDDDDEGIWAVCEGEMAVWKCRCEKTPRPSFQEMVTATRICLRTSIPAPWNEWWNPKTEEWEHMGLRYLRCTEAELEQMKEQVLSQRLLLHGPEMLVSRAIGMLYAGLMQREAWPELVVGMAVLTGQGMMRILKNGRFSRKTDFSLLVRDVAHENPFFPGPFEVPTLGRADLVVEAWERLRNLVGCGSVDEQEILQRYRQVVSDTASKYFLDLVPLPEAETDVFKVLHQSVYPCLALHYYCPPSVDDIEYLAKICDDPLLLADPLPGERFACAAVSKYMEYRVADGRKGVWLDRLGVTVIPVGSVAREEKGGTGQESVQVVLSEEDLCLLDEVRCQMGFGLGSSSTTEGSSGEEEECGEAESEGSLELSITLCNRGVSPVLYAFIKAGLEHLSGEVGEFLSVSLREEMLAGLKLQRPFQTMWSSELRACDHPQATNELLRRAIMMVMRYNRSVSNPTLRWYLNADVLERLVQKSRFYVEWWLEIYQEEIDEHHQQFNLAADGNAKAVPVTEVIHLPDDPGFFKGDVQS